VFVAQHVAAAIEQKRQEDAIRESERRYRQMFENTRAVQLVIDPETGVIVDANLAAVEFYGWPAEKLRGMCVWDINILGEEGVRRADEVDEHAARLAIDYGSHVGGFDGLIRRAATEGLDEREWTWMPKSGEPLTVVLSVTALRNDEGEITGFLHVAADVTERK